MTISKYPATLRDKPNVSAPTTRPVFLSMDLAWKLNRLFEAVHPAGRGPYSPEEVARAITERGTGLSTAYLYMLRSGTRDNPTKKHLEALSRFFEVPVSYFFEEEDVLGTENDLDLIRVVRNPALRLIVKRAAGLSPQAVDIVMRTVELARRAEEGQWRRQASSPASALDKPGASL